MITTIPTVTPRIVAGATVWHLIVDSCPHCGKRHFHGGGSIDNPPGLFGHRVADCGARGGYELERPERLPHGAGETS